MAHEAASRTAGGPLAARARRALDLAWRVVVATVSGCMRHRVTGLAAEGAFFAVLSVPPLIFAFAGAIGYVSEQFSPADVDEVRRAVLELSSRLLTDEAVGSIIRPTLNDVLRGGRFDVISLGFVLALWSGSRALNVFVDTITIMHGLGGQRGIIKTRALSFVLYMLALATGITTVPLMVAGPGLVSSALPERLDVLLAFYWPIVAVVCTCFLATLYHVSLPVRTAWRYNLPGAVFSLVAWVVGSYLLRAVLTATAADSRSVYGPLAAPIAVLLWLYLVAIAVLIGAALNAAVDTVWEQTSTRRARFALRALLPAGRTRAADPAVPAVPAVRAVPAVPLPPDPAPEPPPPCETRPVGALDSPGARRRQ